MRTKFLFLEYGVLIALLVLCVLSFFFRSVLRIFIKKDASHTTLKNSFALPIILGVALVFVTIAIAYVFYSLTKQQTAADFSAEAARIDTAIERRLEVNADLLRGARGLFNASNSVERDEWKKYADSLNLSFNYPAILGLGFGKVVTGAEKESFEMSVQEEGFTNFAIKPSGVRPGYVPVYYIEPFNATNKNAFGFDMFSESIRQSAMAFARDSGDMALTGKIYLAQDSGAEPQPAFIIYTPIYKPSGSRATVAERKTSIFGYVYAALRMNNFIVSILTKSPTNLGIEVFDGGQATALSPERLLYKNDLVVENSPLTHVSNIVFYNHEWTVRYTAPASFGSSVIRNSLSIAILIVGFILSVLVAVVVFVINTRRVKAVELASQMTSDLSVTTNRLQLATSSAKLGVWEWDVVRNKLTWDDRMYELYGIRRQDFSGAYEAWQKGLHPDDKKPGDDAIKLALQGKKKFDIAFRVVWPDGTIRYIKAYADVERDESGKPLKMVGINFDITKEKEVDKAKTEFVSLASHQLRTPLSAINWYTEMLLAGDAGNITDAQRKYLEEVYKGNQRMVELVNALLNVSRLELGTFSVEPVPTDVGAMVDSVAGELKPQVAIKKQNLTVTLEKDLPHIQADPKLLRMVFQNLLSNAVKYTQEGGKIVLTVKQDKKAKALTIAVADNGMGIPQNQKEHIFSKLFRADNVKMTDTEGTGLGLYIVKAIVEQSGGAIRFDSEEGKGTTFYVLFSIDGMKKKIGSKQLS